MILIVAVFEAFGFIKGEGMLCNRFVYGIIVLLRSAQFGRQLSHLTTPLLLFCHGGLQCTAPLIILSSTGCFAPG